MSRTEENDKIIDLVTRQIKKGSEDEPPTAKELIALSLTIMVTILADISRSLAILADKENEDA